MPAESLDFGSLAEWLSGWEVTEEAKKKVAEDGKAAAQAHQQVKKDQKKNAVFALLLSKILQRYYSNEKIIDFLYSFLKEVKKNEKYLEILFLPFIEKSKKFHSIEEFVDYLRDNLDYIDPNIVFEIMEFEKIWWEKLWNNVKNGKADISYKDFKKQILDDLNKLW